MGLFSFLKRSDADTAPKKPAKSGAKSSAAEDVQVLRIRARRRLIGAAVLVAAGVVGFPLVFETQPRPIPVDLPIDIPRKDNAAPLVVPTREPLAATTPEANGTAAAMTPPVTPPAAGPKSGDKLAAASAELPVEKAIDKAVEPPEKAASKAPERAAEKAPEQAAVKPAEKPADKPTTKLAERPQDKPTVKVAEKPAEKAADKPAEKTVDKPKAAPTDGARAQALLDGREPAAARYIVQVGAYGENKAAQEVRGKVEKLGLKTYAQAVDTADGHRVRVRLGPFTSREEAERAAAKLKSAGLPGAILTL